MIADVRQLLIDARETLDAAGVAYAVIGGCARNAYAEPRATKDVDFVVAGDSNSYSAVVSAVVSPEDLIVYKLIAGRTQDFADVEKVVAARAAEGSPLDWAYIDKWCAEWDVAERAARARVNPPQG